MIRAAESEPQLTFEIVTDAVEIARSREQAEQHRRNTDWLQSHWHLLLPQARGKFIAVAGQEATVADTAQEAWAWTAQTHPEDRGATVRYVPKDQRPRIYAYRG
jgi:hypothetical protein